MFRNRSRDFWFVVAVLLIGGLLVWAGGVPNQAPGQEGPGADHDRRGGLDTPIRLSGDGQECRIGLVADAAPDATDYRWRVRMEVSYTDRAGQIVPVTVVTGNGQATVDSQPSVAVVLIGADRRKLNRRPHLATITQSFEPFPGTEVQPPSTETVPIDPTPCQTTH